jgi:hypothetical protein
VSGVSLIASNWLPEKEAGNRNQKQYQRKDLFTTGKYSEKTDIFM